MRCLEQCTAGARVQCWWEQCSCTMPAGIQRELESAWWHRLTHLVHTLASHSLKQTWAHAHVRSLMPSCTPTHKHAHKYLQTGS
jgi:hypothetical protein